MKVTRVLVKSIITHTNVLCALLASLLNAVSTSDVCLNRKLATHSGTTFREKGLVYLAPLQHTGVQVQVICCKSS